MFTYLLNVFYYQCGVVRVERILMVVFPQPFIFHQHSLKHLAHMNGPSACAPQSHRARSLIPKLSAQCVVQSRVPPADVFCVSRASPISTGGLAPDYAHKFGESLSWSLFIVRRFPKSMSSRFPSHFLLMSFHHYLIILLTDTC